MGVFEFYLYLEMVDKVYLLSSLWLTIKETSIDSASFFSFDSYRYFFLLEDLIVSISVKTSFTTSFWWTYGSIFAKVYFISGTSLIGWGNSPWSWPTLLSKRGSENRDDCSWEGFSVIALKDSSSWLDKASVTSGHIVNYLSDWFDWHKVSIFALTTWPPFCSSQP